MYKIRDSSTVIIIIYSEIVSETFFKKSMSTCYGLDDGDTTSVIPSEVLMEIFSYLPNNSFLPICHVSKYFYHTWKTTRTKNHHTTKKTNQTNPLPMLFTCLWKHKMVPIYHTLSTNLLKYYIDNGWEHNINHYYDECGNNTVLRRLFLGTICRGDIPGIHFLFHTFPDQSSSFMMELCTMASAAGQLETLKWLREEKECPWDTVEVHQEASDNLHYDVIDYVELHCKDKTYENHMSYGVGMPWQY